jgi:DUF4097 and DUF4098 domain-containing protein YvlB
MRSVLIMTLVMSTQALGAWGDYEEVRELTLNTRGIGTLVVENGAGSIDITSVSGTDEISVTATILVPGKNEEKARRKIENSLVLTLEQVRDRAELKAYFRNGGGFFNFGDSASVTLDIRLPEGLNLDVEDGSGSIEINNVRGSVVLDDGSGSLNLVDVGGDVEIDDGSGSISIRGVGGDVSINDGSGGITVKDVTGSVIIDDGSGSIDVSDVRKDLIIVNDGSGGLDFSNISGRVESDS